MPPPNAGKSRPQTYLVVSSGTGFDREARLVSADDSQNVPDRPATQHNGLPPSPKRQSILRGGGPFDQCCVRASVIMPKTVVRIGRRSLQYQRISGVFPM
jgi:hypothetical protein